MKLSTVLILVCAVGFFLFKIFRFNALGYTFNDMYAFLQMSRSWMDGRPFMYDNIWGYHHKIHNYYTVLLWGPLCRFFGAYGLFFVQTVLLFTAYWLTDGQLRKQGVTRVARYTVWAVVWLGPVSFWLNDHPNIGWHTELTYLPAALFFVVALLAGSTPAKLLAGLGLVLVKEDGAVLAALLHLSIDGIRFLRRQPIRPVWVWFSTRRFWLISVGWSAVFIIGMLWLTLKNDTPEPRLQQALQLIQDNIGSSQFWTQTLQLLVKSVALLLPLMVLLGFWLRALPQRQALPIAVLWLMGILVLSVLNFVQSTHYYGQPLYYLVSLTWPPRFVLLWGFSVGFLVIVLLNFADAIQPMYLKPQWLVGAVLVWGMQIPILYWARPDFPKPADWAAFLRGRPSPDLMQAYLQPGDLAAIRCIARQLPASASVFAFDYAVPFFHRQYGIWPTGNQYEPADLAVLPIDDPQGLRTKIPMKKPFEIIRLRAYELYVTPAYKNLVNTCR